jgi:serpin B
MGATGETAGQMSQAMRVDDLTKSALADNYKELMQRMANSSGMKIANKIYVQENYEVKASFNEIASKKFSSEAETLDFTNTRESAYKINKWVEDKTNNKIKNLIDPSALDASTQMVLVNAIYFKGLWENQFKKERTRKQPFWVSERESVQVDMMHQTEYFKYANFQQNLDARAILLPYQNSNVSMVILLPNTRTGLKALEAKLTSVELVGLAAKMYQTEVMVSLPRFKIESQVELNQHLQKVRMTIMERVAARNKFFF